MICLVNFEDTWEDGIHEQMEKLFHHHHLIQATTPDDNVVVLDTGTVAQFPEVLPQQRLL